MNATVTKAAKSAKKTAASSARTKPPAAKKAPAKTSVKSLAGKVAKPLKAAGKTSTAAKKASAKSAVKSPKPAVAAKAAKPKTPAATRTSAAKTAKTPTKSAASTKPAAKTAVRPAAKSAAPVRKPVAAAPEKNASRSGATSGKTVSRSTDNIEPSVSKAREVATKTSKASPAPAEGALLTEEQILKMSDKDYMNEAQLAFFKHRLQQLEKELLKNADETTEHLRETVLVPDPADRATIEEEHALELRTRDRERKLLKKVQQSIAAIDSGDYGWCEETGEPIGVARLLARPTATLSLEAQQRRELKQKLYGD